LFVLACDNDSVTNPPASTGDRLLLVTSVGNSTYISTIANLGVASTTNANAFEDLANAYPILYRNWVFMTQIQGGDRIRRYDRSSTGVLSVGPTLSLPQGAVVGDIKVVSDTKAYASLRGLGRLLVFNPSTMTPLNEISLASLAIGDQNPDPGVMHIRAGKMYIALLQLRGFIDAHAVSEIATMDLSSDRIEGKFSDARLHSPSFYGRPGTMFTDEAGDIYVYHTSGFGYIPGLKGGFLRIRSGQTQYDPTYTFDLGTVNVPVTGGRVDYFNDVIYAGSGIAYAIANVPGLVSSPPDYVNDRSFAAVRLNLAAKTIELLPGIPRGNGYGDGLALFDGKVLFGLDTPVGSGIFTYDPKTNAGSALPVTKTVGAPWSLQVLP